MFLPSKPNGDGRMILAKQLITKCCPTCIRTYLQWLFALGFPENCALSKCKHKIFTQIGQWSKTFNLQQCQQKE